MYDSKEIPRFPRHPGEVRNMDDLRRLIDGYDCGIAYMDQHIGQVLDALAELSVLDDCAIIVSSDHGENLGELGIYAEHGTADNITCRIPMIIKWPGCKAGHIDEGLHYNLDLPPTLAALCEKDSKDIWDGQSFANTILEGTDSGREYLVLSQCAHVCQRAVRWEDWIYIKTYHDGFRLLPDELLFNLREDPYEQNDLATAQPEICKKAVAMLDEWHTHMMNTMPDGYSTDPMNTVLAEGGPTHASDQFEGYCKRLEETGRGYAVEELRKRHPQRPKQ